MNIRTTFGITFGFLAVGLSLPAYSDDYSDAVHALNPTHYYRLNETVADTINPTVADTGTMPIFGIHEGDWSGGSNAQVHVPGPNLPGFDANNGAILLHDAGAINLGDGSSFGSPTMSVALWFNNADPTWDGTYGDRMFQNNQSNAAGGFSITIWDNAADEDHGVVLSVASDTRILRTSDVNLQDGGWHHVVAVRNGPDEENLQMYVDGIDRTALLVPTEGFGNTGTTAWIGARDFPGNIGRYSDRLDEVALWLDRALTLPEAQSLYWAATGGVEKTAKLVVDRQTGAMQIVNNTAQPLTIAGYSIFSPIGALNQDNWLSISNHYDAPPNGDGSVDPDDTWHIFSQPGAATDLTEGTLGAATLNHGDSINLGTNVWIKNPTEDLTFEVLLDDNTTAQLAVQFNGNPYIFADLNYDGTIDLDDWNDVFKPNFDKNMTGLSDAQSYSLGDLDGDQDSDLDDFAIFATEFAAAGGSIADLTLSVPEPSTIFLVAMAGPLLLLWQWRSKRIWRQVGLGLGLVAVLVWLGLLMPAHAGSYSDAVLALNPSVYYQLSEPAGAADGDPVANSGTQGSAYNGTWGSGLYTDPYPDREAISGQIGPRPTDSIAGAALVGLEGDNLAAGFVWPGSGNTDMISINVGGEGGSPVALDTAAQTYSLFFNTTQSAGYIRMITTDPEFTHDFSLIMSDVLTTYGNLVLSNHIGTGVEAVMTEETYNDGLWHHVVAIRDSDAQNAMRLYVDGQAATLVPRGGSWTLGYQFRFGALGTGSNGFDGRMDELAIWNRALSEEEAIGLFHAAAPGVSFDPLTLTVNTDTGAVSIGNLNQNPLFDIDIKSYSITSDLNSLNPNNWNSLENQDFDGNGIPNDGIGWEELTGSSRTLAEAFLTGFSTLQEEQTLSLGSVYNTAINAQDLVFVYQDSKFNTIVGLVEYVTGGENADFDGDGDVDGDDFLTWQQGFGMTGTAGKSDGDANGDTNVNAADLAVWKIQFGSGGGSAGMTAAVPEPTTLGLAGFAAIGSVLILLYRKRPSWIRVSSGIYIVIGVTFLATFQAAKASSTLDRLYHFGDDPNEFGSPGVDVFWTFDSYVTSLGDQQDLINVVGAMYVDVGPSGLKRPGATANELGIQFNGVDSYLSGDRLGQPSTSVASSGYDPPGPLDYRDINDRGFQLWVYPMAAGGSVQDIVMDTMDIGLWISEAGNWVMRYREFDYDSGIAVTTNQWHHIMVVRPYGFVGPNSGQRMYIDGLAVAAAVSGYRVTNHPLVIGANSGDDGSDPNIPDAHTENFFHGVLDELEMFVLGQTTGDPSINYGTFSLSEDNKYIAALNLVPGDVNRDNVVNGDGTGPIESDDVSAFIAGWANVQLVNEIPVGDLASRAKGDLDMNGLTNLADWGILRANHPDGPSLDLAALLGVPEPSGLILFVSGCLILFVLRPRYRPASRSLDK